MTAEAVVIRGLMSLMDFIPRSLRVVAGRRSQLLPCELLHRAAHSCLFPNYWSKGGGGSGWSTQDRICIGSFNLDQSDIPSLLPHAICQTHQLWYKDVNSTRSGSLQAILKPGCNRTRKAAFSFFFCWASFLTRMQFPLLFGTTRIWKNVRFFNVSCLFLNFCTALSIFHFIFSFHGGPFLFDLSQRY